MNRSTNKAIEKNNAYKHHIYYRHICYICYIYPHCTERQKIAQVILAFSVFMLAIAERMPETSESIPLIGELDFNFNAGVWYKSQQVFGLGTSCSWCTKLSPGPLFLVHCWRIAIYGKMFFRLISTSVFFLPFYRSKLTQNSPPGIYLTFVMAMTTVSVIMTVMVLNFFYRGPVLTEVPPWVRKWEYSHLNVEAYLALILKKKRSYILHLTIVFLCLWVTD